MENDKQMKRLLKAVENAKTRSELKLAERRLAAYKQGRS